MSHQGQPDVEFTIDGRPFSTGDRTQPADALLRSAGLDPSNYDLAELRGNSPQPHRYADSDDVHIRPGARFVSIRHHADVA
jgi:hypothetical protein